MGEIESQDRDQHQQPAELSEEEELHRRVQPPLMSPDRDQEIHGNQHQFPCEVEQEQIHCQEYAGDPSQYPEKVEVEEPHRIIDLGPGCQHGHDAEEEREHEQQQAQAVQREMEMDAELRGSSSSPIPAARLAGEEDRLGLRCGSRP